VKNTNTHRRAASNGCETHPSHLLDDYVLNRIAFRTRRLAITFRLSDDRRDDFFQDMVVEVLKAAERFDPDGSASWHTYASRVIDLAVKKLTQNECRRIQRESGRPIGLSDSGDGAPSAVNNPAHEGEDDLRQLELHLDIEVVLNEMPSRLQKVCRLLQRLSPAEAAEELGIHRNSIYRLIAKARTYFTDPKFGFVDLGAADSASVRM
jgi:RNA polymerase sigma factor (sigma-70 family)